MAVHARGEAAIIARPGADIQAFCEPVTTRSTPQASISNGTAPRPDTLSTRMSVSGDVSPNDPIDTPRTRSPGDRVLTTAASSPPVPAVVIIAMSLVVPKYGFIPV